MSYMYSYDLQNEAWALQAEPVHQRRPHRRRKHRAGFGTPYGAKSQMVPTALKTRLRTKVRAKYYFGNCLICSEGKRVRWFRAEAEMLRWMEQVELKHAQFARVIDYHDKLSKVWFDASEIGAEEGRSAGVIAFARKQAGIYAKRRELTEQVFNSVGLAELKGGSKDRESRTLLERVTKWREKELHPFMKEFPGYVYIWMPPQ